jgi:hypothetical protein
VFFIKLTFTKQIILCIIYLYNNNISLKNKKKETTIMIFLNLLYTIGFLANVAQAEDKTPQDEMIHVRGLKDYADVLNIAQEFEGSLSFSSSQGRPLGTVLLEKVLPALKEEKKPIIFDVGGGHGYASEELAKAHPDSQVFSVDLVPVPEERKKEVPSNMTFITRKIPSDDLLETYRGKAHLIIDVMGAIAFAENPFEVISYYLELLAPGGEILFNFGQISFLESKPHENPFESILTKNLEIESFTRSITMTELTEQRGAKAKESIDQLTHEANLPPFQHLTSYAVRIIKKKEGGRITSNPWESKFFLEDTPPINIFSKKALAPNAFLVTLLRLKKQS